MRHVTSGARNTASMFVDGLQASGRYTFLRNEVLTATGSSRIAIKNALRRLVAKGRVVAPRRGFYVIVPLEYRATGSPPASWFIDDLMRFQGKPYYVGLLTAASLHGAAHHAPQEFQVVTSDPLRPITLGPIRLRFFTKRSMAKTPTVPVKTETGAMRVSTPEITALDLVRYPTGAGQLGNVATVLSELAEKLDPARLLHAAEGDVELPSIQRLGYLLEVSRKSSLTKALNRWLKEREPRRALLSPGRNAKGSTTNDRWQIVVNEKVEVDT